MKKIIAIGILLISLNIYSQNFKSKWTVIDLEAPESVVFDKNSKTYFVSNVAGQPAEKNGLGYISTISEEGEIITKKWIEGLNAPKGLGVFKNLLFVADIDKVEVIDITKGKIIKTYVAEGATFLNDIEISESGDVYISDTFGGNAIYQIKNEEISLWIKNKTLDYPNGLKIKNGDIYVATWGVVTDPKTFKTDTPGKLLKVNLKTKEIKEFTKSFGNLDGLILLKKSFIVSDWIEGGLFIIDQKGKINKILDLNSGSADILYLEEKNLILVPQMLDGKLTAYSISK
ncbi:hypothetical protein [uncultured Aquimarina sp.]|uniref:hypothetical protein n=1 Tax=uncultured Aquimarina sp. TaxID=575652 RepID=UPI00260A9139|nr:hypothetical protein [uncultured Aquimarina sp.]